MCPSPALVLIGRGWDLLAQPLSITACMGMQSSLPQLEMMEKVSINSSEIFVSKVDITSNYICMHFQALFRARSVYVNHSKCRRLLADIHLGNGKTIQHIQSQRVKILSKPSKKTQKETGSDTHLMFLRNGSHIALYNRVKGQNGSTRYLQCEAHDKLKRGTFCANVKQWSVFKIYLGKYSYLLLVPKSFIWLFS